MKKQLRFTKYHGCGNDFLIVDEIGRTATPDRSRSEMAKILTNRHFQIGADGLMFLEDSKGCDCSMRLFEPAGNEADMCGNGIRCIAAYLMEKLGKDEVAILTRDGIKRIERIGGQYTVEMGRVRTKRSDLKVYITDKGKASDSMLDITFKASSKVYRGAIVNSGEPHIVIKTSDIDSIDLRSIGTSINASRKRFPEGVNVNFVQTAGSHSIKVRTYERGVYDETLACGTGATASAAVALLKKWVKPGEVKVLTKGGQLLIEINEMGAALMTGPATKVFEGEVSVGL